MHLKQLKLAGFKSFVDPTVIPFSSQLIAVVGPNGCGKSNIIDAVRWVMGESSAKHLRGESMADVIFNGSSQRKSLGQASVELVFDNSMGRLTGPYASYQEIVVKRLVTRDGDSFYYLNGSRCRRRDITDIFLGTGAGARSYSIIGQDTISRLIEARPEDLRAYMEEAAGVSKYKERRRETLQRIGQTRENLSRVADIREELAKQLTRLEKQALAARRYTQLKQEERLCKAEILALKWRAIKTEQIPLHQSLTELSLKQEQHRAHIAAYLKNQVILQDKLHAAQADLEQTQLQFYQLKTEIARLEETIQQQQREKERLDTDKADIEAALQSATLLIEKDSDALNVSEQAALLMQARIAELEGEFQQQRSILENHERQKKEWDLNWQQAQMAFNQSQRETQVLQLRIQHVVEREQQTQLRLEKIESERSQIQLEAWREALVKLQAQQDTLHQQLQMSTAEHSKKLEQIALVKQTLIGIEQEHRHAQDKVQQLATEHAVLQAAQDAILRKAKSDAPQTEQWAGNPRLAEVIQVPEKWLRACEMVLGDGLEAVVVDTLDALWPALAGAGGASAVFVESSVLKDQEAPFARLSHQLGGVIPCWLNALDQIFAAEHIAEALAWLPSLERHQSIVTPDGYWLGPGWLRIDSVETDDETGVLFRQQALVNLKDSLAIEQSRLSDLQIQREQIHQTLLADEQALQTFQEMLTQRRDEWRACEGDIHHKQQLLEQALARTVTLSDEQAELHALLDVLATQKMEAELAYTAAIASLTQHEALLEELTSSTVAADDALVISKGATESLRNALHQAQLTYQSETSKIAQFRDNVSREKSNIEALQARLSLIIERSLALMGPDQTLAQSLEQKLMLHQQWDEALSKARECVELVQQALSENERLNKQEEDAAYRVQDQYQQAQLHEQTLAVRADSFIEALTELQEDISQLLANIPADITLQMREQMLTNLDEKVKRLGAINLVAIEEFQAESERKQHLDEQYQDLMDALATLDAAIAKMDKETELRLKDTFDQVNTAFQALFPRLFGGGRAKLELTCDNLLEAGIVVMAQPPGKRNSTIHLLSGGEKAMTAVALVFAIFQLNPSPFCMLDEVDAPLDDLNVRRFCDMVKEMSQFVQFLFITHNKVTMELADHLIGVTMREPGVSRVVAVDVEMALE